MNQLVFRPVTPVQVKGLNQQSQQQTPIFARLVPLSQNNGSCNSLSDSSKRKLVPFGEQYENRERTPTISSTIISCSNGCGATFAKEYNMRRHIRMSCKREVTTDLANLTAERDKLRTRIAEKDKRLKECEVLAEKNRKLMAEVELLKAQNEVMAQSCNQSEIDRKKPIEPILKKPYDSTLPIRTQRRRRKLLMDNVVVQAGNEKSSNMLLWETLRSNKGSLQFLAKHLPKDPKCVQLINASLKAKRGSAIYTRENHIRTAKVIYWGVKKMSKRDFEMTKTAIELMVGGEHSVTPLINYKTEMKFLRRQIAYIRNDLKSVRSLLEPQALENARFLGRGIFQSLEAVAVRLATKLIRAANQPNPVITFNWCGSEYDFHLAVGMDEFPYFNEGISTYMLKFIDIGSQVHSPEQMGMLLVTNFKEGSRACSAYWAHLAQEMKALVEKKDPFSMLLPDGSTVAFRFSFFGVSGDQKAHMEGAGGSSCAFRRPSPYATVDKSKDKDERMKLNGKIGVNWEVLTCEDRTAHAAELEKRIAQFKQKQKREPSAQKINDLIYEIGGQQKIPPPMGWMVDKMYVCTLHVGLLAARDWFDGFLFSFVADLIDFMLKVKCPNSPLPAITRQSAKFPVFAKLHDDEIANGQIGHPIVHLVDSLDRDMRMRKISNKVKDLWEADAKSVTFRFTGQDVKNLCHFGAFLTSTVFWDRILSKLKFASRQTAQFHMLKQRLAFFHFLIILLRKILALINQTEITETELLSIEKLCRQYHSVKVAVNNSSGAKIFHNNDWTMGYVMPFHARKIWSEAKGKGLGLMSMQGHELAHQSTKTFLRKTQSAAKFTQLHEHWELATNLLPSETKEVGLFYCKGGHSKLGYIPACAADIPIDDIICEKSGCKICDSFKNVLLKAAETGEISNFGKK